MEVEVDGCDNKEVEEWIYESSPHAKPHPGTYERDTDFRKDKRLGEGVSKKGRGIFGTSGNPGRPSEFAPGSTFFKTIWNIMDHVVMVLEQAFI